jgi:hypothetical protein
LALLDILKIYQKSTSSMLHYAASLTSVKVGRKYFKFLEKVFTDKPEIVMTYGQVLENKGMERGMERGIAKVATQMIYDGAPVEQVQKWTGLSAVDLGRLSMR